MLHVAPEMNLCISQLLAAINVPLRVYCSSYLYNGNIGRLPLFFDALIVSVQHSINGITYRLHRPNPGALDSSGFNVSSCLSMVLSNMSIPSGFLVSSPPKYTFTCLNIRTILPGSRSMSWPYGECSYPSSSCPCTYRTIGSRSVFTTDFVCIWYIHTWSLILAISPKF